jgi:DNA-binding PadR family transcriptional regulator
MHGHAYSTGGPWGHHKGGPRAAGWRAMTGRRHGPGGGRGPGGPGGPGGVGGPEFFGRHGGFGGPGQWGGFGGPGFGPRGRRRRMRRGDVRAALLVLLDEQSLNGYGLMQEIERRSGGAWRPSPGSVYPALALLEDEGLVRAEEEQGRKLYRLTDEGTKHVAEHRDELGEPWATLAEGVGEGRLELRGLVGQLAAAVMQVAAAGDDAQVARAKELLAATRRGVYRILASDDPADAGSAEADDADEPDQPDAV